MTAVDSPRRLSRAVEAHGSAGVSSWAPGAATTAVDCLGPSLGLGRISTVQLAGVGTLPSVLRGRQLELSAANDLLEAARNGQGRAMIFRGPAGIGRSSFVEELARSARESMTILSVTGRPGGDVFPLGALLDLVPAAYAKLQGLPTPQREALREASAGITTVDTRTTVALALKGFIAHQALTRPVLLVVEDLQWLDGESVALLAFLAHRAHLSPLAMLITERCDSSTRRPNHPPLTELPVCTLRPLDTSDIEAVVHDWTGYAIDPNVTFALCTASQGNPRVLRQLVDTLSSGVLTGGKPLPHPLPAVSQVEEWYGEKVRRLDARSARALAVVTAAVTEPLDVVLEAVEICGADRGELEHLEQLGLIRTDRETVSLAHPLLPSLVEELRGWLQLRYAHAGLATAWSQSEDAAKSKAAQRHHLLLGGLESSDVDLHGEATEANAEEYVRVPFAHRIEGNVDCSLGGSKLTAQEKRIVREIVEGATNAEVAQRLYVSVKTVEFHLHNIYAKLGLRSRTQLVRFALEEANVHPS